MCKFKNFKNALAAFIVVVFVLGIAATTTYSQSGHRLTTPIGDIAFEVVGQVSNPSAATSQQYGYLSLVKGLNANQIFDTAVPTMQNETTARFTFFTDAVTERTISNGRLRIVNRTGTTTIYYDDTPDGTFADRSSFADGVPILTLNYRQQVILDTADTTFTVVNLLEVVLSHSFVIDGENLRLGKAKDHFRQFYSGAPPTGTPALNGVFAGYAVAIEPAEPN